MMRKESLIVGSLIVFFAMAARADDPQSGLVNDSGNVPTATADRSRPLPGTREYEFRKFDNPSEWVFDDDSGYPSGPKGTPFEDVYRSLTMSSERAVASDLPSHDDAIAAIDESAAGSNGSTQRHKMFVLSVKHQSEEHRPESATRALREIFGRLVDRELSSDWNSQATEPEVPFRHDPNLTIHRDVEYGNADREQQRMDAYLVPSAQPTPVLVEFHGGGWRRGRRSVFSSYKGDLIRQVLDAGISVISVDYRLAPKYRFPAQLEDAARAVQFVRSKADEWNIDPNRISAIGGSAGGHLLSWVALNDDQARPTDLDPVARQSSRLTCFIVQWAPLDLTRINPLELMRHGPRGPDAATAFCSALAILPEDYRKPENQIRIRAASPVFQVTDDDPPAFVMYGGAPEDFHPDNPPAIPAAIHDPHSWLHGLVLIQALKQAGVPHVAHVGPAVGKNNDADNVAILSFLKRYFRMNTSGASSQSP